MDFGIKFVFDNLATQPDRPLPIAWFERSSGTEWRWIWNRGGDSNSLLDRFRESGGLVYSGEGEDDL
jgi:hypothetical protein